MRQNIIPFEVSCHFSKNYTGKALLFILRYVYCHFIAKITSLAANSFRCFMSFQPKLQGTVLLLIPFYCCLFGGYILQH